MTTVHILSLDYESRGVAKLGGKTVFVHNALPQETVRIRITQDKAHFAEAQVEQIVQPSPYRRAPACPHYGDCGGCAMQHVEFAAQVAMKQRVFEEQLQRIGKVQPESLLPPVYGTPWHYRSRTRLAVHTSANGKGVLGYQAKRSHKIVGINQCLLLPEHVSGCLNIIRDALQDMVNAQPKVGIRSVEISVGEGVTAVNIISHKRQPENVLRALAGCLNRRGGKQIWQVWQQIGSAKPQAVSPQDAPPLVFRLPEFGLTMPFQLGDFTQVNLPLNEIMVARAVRYLDPQPHERIADLFCGLGNFTLPLATRAAEVVGIEGSALCQRQREIAQPAEQIGDALVRLRVKITHRARHHNLVERQVDLGEIAQLKRHGQAKLRQPENQRRRIVRRHGLRFRVAYLLPHLPNCFTARAAIEAA